MDFQKRLQERIAGIAIGPSSFRNPGTGGVVKLGREFCSQVDLKNLCEQLKMKNYSTFLDQLTKKLEENIIEHFNINRPSLENKSAWGLARKGLNIFVRDSFDNRYMSKYYNFEEEFKWQLEIPLDRHTVTMITKELQVHYPKSEIRLPTWRGVKNLSMEDSILYQKAANELAKIHKITPVDLDVIYWRHSDLFD